MKKTNLIIYLFLAASLLISCTSPAPSALPQTPSPTMQQVTPIPVVSPTTSPQSNPTASPQPTETATPRPRIKPGDSVEFMNGIAYIASHVPDWAYPLSDQSLLALRETGATWVSLNAFITQGDDPEISRQATIHAIQEAHRLGLNVFLRPKFEDTNLQSYHHETGYSAEQWQAWADRHTEELLPYAQIAEDYQVEMFSVGYEMRATEPEAEHWRAIIQKVREVYQGPLTYSSLPNEEADITWWDAVDFIGVDGYYNLSNSANPSETELKKGWVPYLNNLKQLSQKYNKSVILTEIGYPSTVSAAADPGNWMHGTIDLELQARLYKVLFEVIRENSWIRGVFIWAWDETPYQGGTCDFEHTPKGKPAENVMREFFGAPTVNLPAAVPDLPVFNEQQIVTYSLFDDTFYSFMDPGWSWNTHFEEVTTPTPLGTSSLQVTMNENSGFVFYLGEVDIRSYQWLEFYLYRDDEQSIPLRIMASTPNQTMLINRQIRSCWYAEGGTVPNKTWTRVVIPLEHLNIHEPIQTIALIKWEEGELKFWIDDVRLVGAKK